MIALELDLVFGTWGKVLEHNSAQTSVIAGCLVVCCDLLTKLEFSFHCD